ncbi:MAG: tetratricopeptide repeat protein [Betaproteobacteria bacterium]|nr:tetratricopeptide repeat protein [Betaproteobacteria bacterium]
MTESWLPGLSSRMTPTQIEACIGQCPALRVQPSYPGACVAPHWGLLGESAAALPPPVRKRITRVVNLLDAGDIERAEKTILRLTPDAVIPIGDRMIRAIKLKGISPRLSTIKRGEARHVRLPGRGDIPILVPYLTPAGTVREIPYDVGEPYGAKRFRSVANEIAITRIAARDGCQVLVPLGFGIYRDADLRFKGEPAAFSIWGLEHSDDERFDAQWRQRFARDSDDLRELAARDRVGYRSRFEVAFGWVRDHLEAILAAAARYHRAGLVHHEPQFDNHGFYGDTPTVMDWEEAAHCSRLTRAQFVESVLIDVFKLICYCCAYEWEFANLAEQMSAGREPELSPHNWFTAYFGTLNSATTARLGALLPLRLGESEGRSAFREAMLPLVEEHCNDLAFGGGVDWDDVARPFSSGFSADAPAWQPDASTTFDLRLYVRKGARGLPGSDRIVHPSEPIREAEQTLYDGRFSEARDRYERILAQEPAASPHQAYLHHNLASLCFALREDAAAKAWFDRAYPQGPA